MTPPANANTAMLVRWTKSRASDLEWLRRHTGTQIGDLFRVTRTGKRTVVSAEVGLRSAGAVANDLGYGPAVVVRDWSSASEIGPTGDRKGPDADELAQDADEREVVGTRKRTGSEKRRAQRLAVELSAAHAEGAHDGMNVDTRCQACLDRLNAGKPAPPSNVVQFPTDRMREAPTTDELMRLLRREIASGRLDDHLHDVWQALKARHKAKQNIRQATAAATLYVGARVKVASTAKPRELAGAEGEVTKMMRTRCVVRLDNGLIYRMPFSLVEVL